MTTRNIENIKSNQAVILDTAVGQNGASQHVGMKEWYRTT